jgi:Bacterial PH domain
MAAPKDSPDPAEPDLYWAGHSGWAMLPGVVVGIVASLVVMFGLPRLGDWLDLPDEWTAVVRFWLILIGWLAAAAVWAYRGGSFVYRLTPTRLYADFGMLYRPTASIALEQVTAVECRAWALRRLFGVGAVIIRAEGRPPVRLRGIFRPDEFARAIQEAVRKTRSG